MKKSIVLLALVVILAFLLFDRTPAPVSNRGRVIVITGASSGFGKGAALRLAQQGAHVVLAARSTALLTEIAAECERLGGQALAVTTDVASESEVKRLADAAVARFGRIDVWINNAGVGALGRFDEIPLADHKRLVDVNLGGVINGSYYAIRRFRQQHSGTLVNVSSVAGKIGLPYFASYAATKHAIIGLGSSLNQELRLNGEKNISVSTVCPFATNTPFWEHAANYTGHTTKTDSMDDATEVIDAIVAATTSPEREVAVGYKTKLLFAAARVAPELTDDKVGNVMQKEQRKKSQLAPPTSGTLYQPAEGADTADTAGE